MGTVAPQLRAPGSQLSGVQVRQRLQSHLVGHQQQQQFVPQPTLPAVHNMLSTPPPPPPQQHQLQQTQHVMLADNLAHTMLLEQQQQPQPQQQPLQSGTPLLLTVTDPSTGQVVGHINWPGGAQVTQMESVIPVTTMTTEDQYPNSLLADLGEQSQAQGQQFDISLPSENLLVTGTQLQLVTSSDSQFYDPSLALASNSIDSTLASLHSTPTNMPARLEDFPDCIRILCDLINYSYSTLLLTTKFACRKFSLVS